MRIAGNIVGILLFLMGGLWSLQGANVIGGSMMSGHSQWLVIGVILLFVGLGVLYWANMPKGRKP